jgi:hypothetical protein
MSITGIILPTFPLPLNEYGQKINDAPRGISEQLYRATDYKGILYQLQYWYGKEIDPCLSELFEERVSSGTVIHNNITYDLYKTSILSFVKEDDSVIRVIGIGETTWPGWLF